MSNDPVFTFTRKETHYVTYTLAEIQEMMLGHIVDSELYGDDRWSDDKIVDYFIDQVNSWMDASLSEAVDGDAMLGGSSDWELERNEK